MSDVILYSVFLLFSAVVMLLARFKNRKWWLWGLVAWVFLPFPGGAAYAPALFTIILIAIVFVSPVCPECKFPITRREWKTGDCPRCDTDDGEHSEKTLGTGKIGHPVRSNK
jgi:hypothetical protein